MAHAVIPAYTVIPALSYVIPVLSYVIPALSYVIPAQAGTHHDLSPQLSYFLIIEFQFTNYRLEIFAGWVPAFAGMT